MTASHLQVLPAGPVKLIGLPPAAMGVANARVLHRRMLNNVNNNTINNNNNNPLSLLRAKRSLFGSPDPGEMQQIYKDEERKNRQHFIERYNFDIINEKFVNNNESAILVQTSTSSSTTVAADENSNISTDDDESQYEEVSENSEQSNNDECEERLHDGENDQNDDDVECKNQNFKCNHDHKVAISNNNNNDTNFILNQIEGAPPTSPVTSTTTTISASPSSLKDKKSNERIKPYSRQASITDFYSHRKGTISTSVIVSQLPKPQNAIIHDQQQQNQQSIQINENL